MAIESTGGKTLQCRASRRPPESAGHQPEQEDAELEAELLAEMQQPGWLEREWSLLRAILYVRTHKKQRGDDEKNHSRLPRPRA